MLRLQAELAKGDNKNRSPRVSKGSKFKITLCEFRRV